MRSPLTTPCSGSRPHPRPADLESGCRSCHDWREEKPGSPLRRASTFNFTFGFNQSMAGQFTMPDAGLMTPAAAASPLAGHATARGRAAHPHRNISGRNGEPGRRKPGERPIDVRRPAQAACAPWASATWTESCPASSALDPTLGTGFSESRDPRSSIRSARSTPARGMPLPRRAICFFTFAPSARTSPSSWRRRS